MASRPDVAVVRAFLRSGRFYPVGRQLFPSPEAGFIMKSPLSSLVGQPGTCSHDQRWGPSLPARDVCDIFVTIRVTIGAFDATGVGVSDSGVLVARVGPYVFLRWMLGTC